jgi:hypothetical protein
MYYTYNIVGNESFTVVFPIFNFLKSNRNNKYKKQIKRLSIKITTAPIEMLIF